MANNFDENCECNIKIRTQENFIEQFNFDTNDWEQFYPDFRVYKVEKEYISLLARDNKTITYHLGCIVEIDGIEFDSFEDVFNQFELFVVNFNCACGGSGGTGFTAASNGLRVDNLNPERVIMGAPLDRDTTITEDGFNHIHSRNEILNISGDNYDTLTKYESGISNVLPIDGTNIQSFRRLMSSGLETESEIGVISDGEFNYDSTVYARSRNKLGTNFSYLVLNKDIWQVGFNSNNSTNISRISLNTNGFSVQLGAAATIGAFASGLVNLVATTQITEAYPKKVETIDSSSIRETYAIDYTTTTNSNETYFSIAISELETVQVLVKLNFRRVANNGSGWTDGIGGCFRDLGSGAILTNNNMIRRLQEDGIVGQNPRLNHDVSGNNYILQIDSNSNISTKFVGVLEIIKTQF